jgi:acetyltransferase AlgX (SGNH hydrolase-like protein)
MKRFRPLLGNLALAALSLILAGAALEGAARVWAARLAGGPDTIRDPLLRFDPDLGWSKPPGGRAIIQRPEYRTEIRINSHGLRGPERAYEKPPGVRRVLLLGDSFVEGYTVPEPATVAVRLEQALMKLKTDGGGSWEVVNGGTHGWSTDQEYLFWRAEGARYGADDVVLFFYYNDLFGNVSDDGKPRFEGDGDGWRLANAPVPRPREGQARGDRARPFFVQPWRGSMALRLLSNRTSAGLPEVHRVLAAAGLVEPDEEGPPPPELQPFSAVYRAETDRMWERTQAVLERLAREVAASGSRFFVFYVPARFEVNEPARRLTWRRYRLGPRWKAERVVDRLRGVCADLGLPLLDPRAELAVLEQSGRPGYLPVDGHWTGAGHEAAATILARVLLRH